MLGEFSAIISSGFSRAVVDEKTSSVRANSCAGDLDSARVMRLFFHRVKD